MAVCSFFSSRRRHTRFKCDWSSDLCFFFSSRRRHTRFKCDWGSDVCSSDLLDQPQLDVDGVYYDTIDIELRLVERAFLSPIGSGYLTLPGTIIPNPIPGIPGVPLNTPDRKSVV